MSGVLAIMGAATVSGGSSGHLDAISMTTGGTGTVGSRERGWTFGQYGSITPDTSAIYGNTAIGNLNWAENGGSPYYLLGINSATNTGWTTMTIGSTALTRASASYISAGLWQWTTSDTASTQAFGTQGSSVTIYFD